MNELEKEEQYCKEQIKKVSFELALLNLNKADNPEKKKILEQEHKLLCEKYKRIHFKILQSENKGGR